jgi:hypothetical protein
MLLLIRAPRPSATTMPGHGGDAPGPDDEHVPYEDDDEGEEQSS